MANYYMLIDSEEIVMSVVTLAKKHGWKEGEWCRRIGWQNVKVFYVLEKERKINGSRTHDRAAFTEIMSINYLTSLFQIPLVVCNIGVYPVVKTDTGIKVGCQEVTKEQIKYIYDAVFNNS